ncbi:MAG: hypothetical protein BIFFINMI_00389 [Phycisphaerae bacterium]|nr:hypothetical protein [Phycisphaerae bacterium]
MPELTYFQALGIVLYLFTTGVSFGAKLWGVIQDSASRSWLSP